MNGFNYYRIKTSWRGENENGEITKRKTEELVYASSYTEAEKVAYELIRQQERCRLDDRIEIEIVKTKIEEIIYNDNLQKDDTLTCGLINCFFEEGDETGVGLYGVKVMFVLIDERSGKEKRSHSVIYTPAKSNADASALVGQYLKGSTDRGDFVVRDAKFDPTSAILWPKEEYENKTKTYSLT